MRNRNNFINYDPIKNKKHIQMATEKKPIIKEENSTINNIHDKLYRSTFSHPQVIIDFLKKNLPQKVFKNINLNTLQLTNKSFVSEKYSDQHSDLIHRAKIKNSNNNLYTLVEHQSTDDKNIGIRLLEYTTSLIRQHTKEFKTNKFPIVLTILLYSSKKKYTGPNNNLEMFENYKLAQELMQTKNFFKIDLQTINIKDLINQGDSSLALILLKYVIQ